MALTPDHIPGPALDMGGLSPEAEQDIELGAALYWGRVAADGALQPPLPPQYSSRTNHGRGRAGESKRPRRSGQPATPIKALFFLCKPSYIYL